MNIFALRRGIAFCVPDRRQVLKSPANGVTNSIFFCLRHVSIMYTLCETGSPILLIPACGTAPPGPGFARHILPGRLLPNPQAPEYGFISNYGGVGYGFFIRKEVSLSHQTQKTKPFPWMPRGQAQKRWTRYHQKLHGNPYHCDKWYDDNERQATGFMVRPLVKKSFSRIILAHPFFLPCFFHTVVGMWAK